MIKLHSKIKLHSSAVLLLCFASCPSIADESAIEEKYQKACKICHEAGLMAAPTVGDAAAWAPRLAQGNEVLLKHVKEGFKTMPPKGMCTDCTDEEFLKLIDRMAK